VNGPNTLQNWRNFYATKPKLKLDLFYKRKYHRKLQLFSNFSQSFFCWCLMWR